ncbi:hypothetical protein Pmani_021825 [Petrolisthes manimaculis]|uniref:G-protein coupled receptor 112 n=1 Tax=Petrolisthes manimaculis TaxID=1843537 RepID=A0AAE1U531_9EUCA|nr:hypothetical protein Pmani_021825 [Petrolisthes manimaculis]
MIKTPTEVTVVVRKTVSSATPTAVPITSTIQSAATITPNTITTISATTTATTQPTTQPTTTSTTTTTTTPQPTTTPSTTTTTTTTQPTTTPSTTTNQPTTNPTTTGAETTTISGPLTTIWTPTQPDPLPLPSCQPTLSVGEAGCVLLNTTPMTWTKAQSFCRRNGGFLLGREHLHSLRDTSGKNTTQSETMNSSHAENFTFLSTVSQSEQLWWTSLFPSVGETYQWLSQYPIYASFVPWMRKIDGMGEGEGEGRCAGLHPHSTSFAPVPCSSTLLSGCYIPPYSVHQVNERKVVLKVVASLGDVRMSVDGDMVRVSEDQFPSLSLTCLAVSPTSLEPLFPQTELFWSKDGMYLHPGSSIIIPAAVHDPSKSSWQNTPQSALAQGAYACHTWSVLSPTITVSNTVQVTLEEWQVLVILVRGEVEHTEEGIPNAVDGVTDDREETTDIPQRISSTTENVTLGLNPTQDGVTYTTKRVTDTRKNHTHTRKGTAGIKKGVSRVKKGAARTMMEAANTRERVTRASLKVLNTNIEVIDARKDAIINKVKEIYNATIPGFMNLTFHLIPLQKEEVGVDSRSKDYFEYRFRVDIRSDSQAFKSLFSDMIDVNNLDSTVKMDFGHMHVSIFFPSLCVGGSVEHLYSNKVKWPPLSEVGEVSPLNYRCVVEGERLGYGYCKWNYTHGALIEFADSKCKRFDFCPRWFTGIINHLCVGLTKLGPWDSSLRDAHFNNVIIESTDSYIDAREIEPSQDQNDIVRNVVGEETIWMPYRRLAPWGPIIYFDDLNQYFFVLNNSITKSWSWNIDHPRPEHDCVALNIKSKRLSTLSCQSNLPFVSFINFRGLNSIPNPGWKEQAPGLIVDSSPFCPQGWSTTEFAAPDRFCFKLFQNLSNKTREEAQKFCQSKDSVLPTPNMGFLDFVYRQYLNDSGVDEVWMSLDPPHPYHTKDQVSHYINWLPKTNFKLELPMLTQMGWSMQSEDKTRSNVLCQMDLLHKAGTKIDLHRSSYPSSESVCVQVSHGEYLKDDVSSVKCFVNGKLAQLKTTDNLNCGLIIDSESEGFYQCLGWMEKPIMLIESNVLLYTKLNTKTFTVTLGVDEPYTPLVHDITFQLTNQTEFHPCVTSAFRNLNDSFWLYNEATIMASNMYYSRAKATSKLNVNFQISVVLYNGDSINLGEDEILKKIADTLLSATASSKCSFLGVRSTRGCIPKVTRDSGFSERNLTWPGTAGHQIVLPKELCVTQTGEPVTRECTGDFLTGFEWEEKVGGCASQVSNVTKQLWKISQSEQSGNDSLISSLSNLTSNGKSLKPVDLHLVATEFQSIAKEDVTSTADLESIVQTLNNVMEADSEAFKTVQNRLNSSSLLFEAFENITFKIQHPETKNQRMKANRPLVSVERIDVELNSNIIGYQSRVEGKEEKVVFGDTKIDVRENEAAIIFPSEIGSVITSLPDNKLVSKNETLQLIFAVYRNSKLFQDGESFPNFTVNSSILQATFGGRTVQNLKKPVKLLFKSHRDGKERLCVFWNFAKNSGKGGWSTQGCWNGGMEGDQQVCYCNHLTCFAQLINYGDNVFGEVHSIVLDIITYIGCITSAVCLLLVFTTFMLFKKWRKPLSNKILLNLSISVFLSLAIFLGGINQTWNALLCRSVAVSLHYFILASFGWMLVEAVHQYLKFVKVVGTYIPRFMWKASVCAWGLPFLPIVAVLVYDSTLYDSDSHKDAKMCWMSSTGFIYSFLPPLTLIMTVNLIMFGLIIYGATCGRVKVTSTLPERDLRLSQLRMAISVFFLLGFTWIFGLLAFWKGRLVFSYLFCIFNTLQGFFIFLFHVFRERSARRFWRELLSAFTSSPNSSEQQTTQNLDSQLGHYASCPTKPRSSDSEVAFNPNQVTKTKINLDLDRSMTTFA